MIKLKTILQESIIGNKIHCNKCNWNWKIADGGADLYVCHKCGHDNTPTLKEQTSKITDLFIGQARPEYNSDSPPFGRSGILSGRSTFSYETP